MHAFLLISDTIPPQNTLEDLIKEQFETQVTFEISTVAETKSLRQFFKFSPNTKTLVILTGIDQAKPEAQNSILKLIEEPVGSNTTFLLMSKSESLVIPTILSRVSVLRLDKPKEIQTESPLTGPAKDWFTQIGSITDREEALAMLSKIPSESALTAIEALRKNGTVSLHLAKFIISNLGTN